MEKQEQYNGAFDGELCFKLGILAGHLKPPSFTMVN